MIEQLVNLKKETAEKLQKSINAFSSALNTLKGNRANISILDKIRVDSYGSMVSLEQVATISVPEPRTVVVTVWDSNMVMPVEVAIRNADIGINPAVDGTKIRLPFPPLTEETRKEIVKKAEKLAEESRISIRQVRKNHLDEIKNLEKNKLLSEDESKLEVKHFEDDIKEAIKEIDTILDKKSKETMQV